MVSPIFLLSGIGMITVGIVAIWYWRNYCYAPWLGFAFGAGAWTITVALKFGFAISFNSIVYGGLYENLPDIAALIFFSFYVGLLTGFFECGGSYLIIAKTRIAKYDWDKAVAFGVGFGAFEAILLGLNSLAVFLIALFYPQLMPAGVLSSLEFSPLLIPIGPFERVLAILIHVYTIILIFIAIWSHRINFFMESFVFKTLLDGVAGWANVAPGIELRQPMTAWAIEGIFILFAIFALYRLRMLSDQHGANKPNRPLKTV